jgi:hypothetical protein
MLSHTAPLIRRTLLLLLAGCAWPVAALASPQGFELREFETRLVDGVYQLDFRVDYRLTAALIEALSNGVDLVIEVEIEIERERRWWLDADVATLRQGYRLGYHALSGTYQVENFNTGVVRVYPSLGSALWALGYVRGLPLIDATLLEDEARYFVRLQARVEPEALPLPLRARAYVSSEWRPATEWYQWPLR